jgi:hypothetical protein
MLIFLSCKAKYAKHLVAIQYIKKELRILTSNSE